MFVTFFLITIFIIIRIIRIIRIIITIRIRIRIQILIIRRIRIIISKKDYLNLVMYFHDLSTRIKFCYNLYKLHLVTNVLKCSIC